MEFSDGMRRLTRNLLDSQDERRATISSLRANTREQLAAGRAERQERASARRQQINQEMAERRRRLRQALDDATASRKESVTVLKAQAAVQRQKERDAYREMAFQQRQRLGDFRESLGTRVIALRQDVATWRDEQNASFLGTVADQDRRLAAGRAQLTQEVDGLRAQFQVEGGQIRADLDQARRIWQRTTQLSQGKQTGVPDALSSPLVAADDLTVISGIGPTTQVRLNEAGIYTFDQIAHGAPETLREILGRVGTLAKLDDWIAQARELAGQR